MTAVLPRTLALGGGSIKQLGNVLRQHGVTKPLVVTDKPLVALGVVDRVVRELGASCEVYDDTVPDPTSDTCDALAARLAFGDFDGVVAVGGGSPMDTAKAACVLRDLGGRMRDYKAPALTDRTLSLPLIAVPTTAGTGSEATRFTIVVDSASGEKMLCAGAAFVPAGAVVDYELTMGAPRALTADTGVDALCHAMEAYVSRKANPLADGFALDALRTIGASLRGACDDDPAGREGMMRASLYAGVAFSSSSVTLVHGMSRPGQDKGDSTSLQRECSAHARSRKSIHASRPFREMIARPKISRNEWKTAELGAFEVGNFALLSCPGRGRSARASTSPTAGPTPCSCPS
jgi:alcohol dehydrogenase